MDESNHQTPAAAAQARPKRVLCIEDEFFISELYSRALKKAGYEVTVEVDGMKGLSMAMTDEYDIVLLDIMVPNVVGVDILKHLREERPHLKAKIVITTNLEQSKENRAEMEKLADGYIVKAEVTPRQLVDF